MTAVFEHRRLVAFSETDSAGIVHFAQLFRYMEDAEHAFFRSLGLSVHTTGDDGSFRGFPRVHASADFLAPLRFEDEVLVRVFVSSLGRSSVRWRFEVLRCEGDLLCARGETVTVCTERATGGAAMKSVPLPDRLASAVAEHAASEARP